MAVTVGPRLRRLHARGGQFGQELADVPFHENRYILVHRCGVEFGTGTREMLGYDVSRNGRETGTEVIQDMGKSLGVGVWVMTHETKDNINNRSGLRPCRVNQLKCDVESIKETSR